MADKDHAMNGPRGLLHE